MHAHILFQVIKGQSIRNQTFKLINTIHQFDLIKHSKFAVPQILFVSHSIG